MLGSARLERRAARRAERGDQVVATQPVVTLLKLEDRITAQGGELNAQQAERLRAETTTQAQEMSDVHVQVLTSGFWPTYKEEQFNVPDEVGRATEAFQRYYDVRTSSRNLRSLDSDFDSSDC